MSLFRSAVTGRDGSVDAGYLAIFWTFASTVTMIPVVSAFCFFLTLRIPDKAPEIITGLAMVIGALGVQCAAVIGAVGMYRMGDKERGPPPQAPQQVTVNAGPPSEISIGTKSEG